MPQAAAAENNATLFEQYLALKEENPNLRAREAATQLGVSEGELLAARVGTDAARLVDDAQAILEAVKPLGEVMALSRNDFCVHERKGVYDNVSFSQHGPMKMGLAVNPDIDLRMFMNHWKFCFAATETTRGGPRKSLQFFDKSGTAVHKIYLTSKSDEAAYDALVTKFTASEQPNFIETEAYPEKPAAPELSDEQIAAFRADWAELKDTHDFYPLLMKYKLDKHRDLAVKLAASDQAYEVEPSSVRAVLELARDKKCEIMVFVGNRGMVQIHTGPVNKLLEHNSWFNVMDPMFNLHLDEAHVSSTWVTLKPTEDGIVTALEVFDSNNDLMATFFGKRKPGIPELPLWREVVNALPRKA